MQPASLAAKVYGDHRDLHSFPTRRSSDLHSANLKILKEIDRICRKYKIQYALDAGTLIGAVRHKGFIPWDDDADIVFTRNQFEAFKKVVRRELPDTMELVEPDSFHGGKAFFDFTPRIIYKKKPYASG